MAQDILILEPDREFAVRLVRSLNRMGSFTVSVVPNVKEACLHLVQTPKVLAFIPIHDGAKIIRSLRAIQPDLRLILVTPSSDIEIPVTYSGRVQGVLIKSMLDVDLPIILPEALSQPFYVRGSVTFEPPQPGGSLDTAVLVTALHQASLGRFVKTAVFSRDNKLLAYWGDLNERESATVALHVGKEWADSPHSDRLQFLHLPARAGDMLLYTHRITQNYLLTLVAVPETPINELRKKAQPLVSRLEEIINGRVPTTSDSLSFAIKEGNVYGRVSYAIVWRPQEPLADALQTPLRQALLRLAVANGCVLNHIHFQQDLIHIVVTCPPHRDAVWAASLFKNGSEQTIQQEYGVVVSLWEAGFYAAETNKPLTDDELSLFLKHSFSAS